MLLRVCVLVCVLVCVCVCVCACLVFHWGASLVTCPTSASSSSSFYFKMLALWNVVFRLRQRTVDEQLRGAQRTRRMAENGLKGTDIPAGPPSISLGT